MISVVIPTHNRLVQLKKALAALERQQYASEDFEVVVVSDGSSDGTNEYVCSMASTLRLSLITQPNRGPAAARNRGVAAASGDIVLFLDDDMVPAPVLLSEHMRLHSANPGVVVLGPLLTPSDHRLSAWVDHEQASLAKQYAMMTAAAWQPSGRQFYTGNASVARATLLAIGGFDERYRRAEDVQLGYRLARQGIRFLFNPRAAAYHYAERSFAVWRQTPYAYGRNDAIFCREGEAWLLPTIRAEFAGRHWLTRGLVKTSLGRPLVSRVAYFLLCCTGRAAYGLGASRVSRAAYSALFHLSYYQGVMDETGNKEAVLGGAP